MPGSRHIFPLFALLTCLALAMTTLADEAFDLNLRAWIQPAPRSAQFSDPDYFIWCGTMVRDDAGVFVGSALADAYRGISRICRVRLGGRASRDLQSLTPSVLRTSPENASAKADPTG
jgi:hypothetical protein